jgi:hypothetical protein
MSEDVQVRLLGRTVLCLLNKDRGAAAAVAASARSANVNIAMKDFRASQ